MEDSRIRIKVQPVIMAAGKSSRLWPLTREDAPKQFCRLIDRQSMLQLTLQRVMRLQQANLMEILPAIVVVQEKHVLRVKRQLEQMRYQKDYQILALPDASKETGVNLTLVAQITQPDAIMISLPADHYIADGEAFVHTATEVVLKCIESTTPVLVTTTPKDYSEAYGYVKTHMGRVERFVEKPTYSRAIELIKEGYVWNTGIYACRANDWLAFVDRIDKTVSVMSRTLMAIPGKSIVENGVNVWKTNPVYWTAMSSKTLEDLVISAVQFHGEYIGAEPLRAEWRDVGSFKGLRDALGKDVKNVAMGNVEFVSSHSCLGVAPGKPMVFVGLTDVVCIETADAILVANINEDYSGVLAASALEHKTKAWGHYDVIGRQPRELTKILHILKGQSISLQRHIHRDEEWTVLRGEGVLTLGKQKISIKKDDKVFIPRGTIHQVLNTGDSSLQILEKQTGDILDENDIVRLNSVPV